MVVYENFFEFCLGQNILIQLLKNVLIDNYYKTICGPVRNKYFSSGDTPQFSPNYLASQKNAFK